MALTLEQLQRIRGNLKIDQPTTPSSQPRGALERLRERQTTPVAPIAPVTPEVTPTPSIQPSPIKKEGFVSGVKEAGRESVQDVRKAFERGRKGEQTIVETAFQTTGEAIQLGGNVLFESAKGLFNLITKATGALTLGQTEEEIRGKLSAPFSKIAKSDIGRSGLEALSKGFNAYEGWKAKNPKDAANIEASISFGDLLLASGVTKKIVGKGTAKLAEKIAPKLTSKEIRVALKEGRVVRTGRFGKILGKADKVKVNNRVLNSADTLLGRIAGVKKMNDAQIANAAGKEIAKISNNIAPDLQKVKLLDETKDSIIDSWATVKETQQTQSQFFTGKALEVSQKNFDDAVAQMIIADNADDLWRTIIHYDNTVKSNIKSATSQSSDALQEAKDVWLDSRRILRDALDDVTNQIPDAKIANEFRAMSNLYTAKNNIINAGRFEKGKGNIFKRLFIAGLAGSAATILGSRLID